MIKLSDTLFFGVRRKIFKEGYAAGTEDSIRSDEYSNPYSGLDAEAYKQGYIAGAKSVGVSDAKHDAKLSYVLPKPYSEGSLGRVAYDEAHRAKMQRIARRRPEAAVPKPLLTYYNR